MPGHDQRCFILDFRNLTLRCVHIALICPGTGGVARYALAVQPISISDSGVGGLDPARVGQDRLCWRRRLCLGTTIVSREFAADPSDYWGSSTAGPCTTHPDEFICVPVGLQERCAELLAGLSAYQGIAEPPMSGELRPS